MEAHAPGRVSTGNAGVDRILRGGLPHGRMYLVQGAPGSGKTTFALQFLLDGRQRNERCLYVSFSETTQELEDVATSHGWSLGGIEIHDLTAILEGRLEEDEESSLFAPAEVELVEATRPLLEDVDRLHPARIVLDSLSELRMLAGSPLRYRRRILLLKQRLARAGCTTLFLDDLTSDPTGQLQLQSLAHGVIELDQHAPEYGEERRRIRVRKMRGVDFTGGYHDFKLAHGGAVVYPRLVATEHRVDFVQARLSSNLKELDELVGGGLPRGSSTLVVGPAGVGKSLLVSLYAIAAASRGEQVALFSFEEGLAQFLERSHGLGLPVDDCLASGKLRFHMMDPAELSPSEFTHVVQRAVEQDGARVVGIDSLNGYLNAMPGERALTLQLHELLSYLNLRGVLSFLITALHGLVGIRADAPVDVSYIADNVLLLRYFEAKGHVRTALSVVKTRAGAHETTIRELLLSPAGVAIGPPIEDFQGVLSGAPTFVGETAALLEDDT